MNDNNTTKDSSKPGKSLPELLGQLVDNASAVFHHEIEQISEGIKKDNLQKLLDHKVDLVMESALKPAIGKRIRAEVEYV